MREDGLFNLRVLVCAACNFPISFLSDYVEDLPGYICVRNGNVQAHIETKELLHVKIMRLNEGTPQSIDENGNEINETEEISETAIYVSCLNCSKQIGKMAVGKTS